MESVFGTIAWLPMGANFDAVKSGYDLMLSKGVNVVTNDEIRQKISLLYENRYPWLRDFLKDRQNFESRMLRTDMMDKFKTFKVMKSAVPRNYDQLKFDDDFKVRIDQNHHICKLTIGYYQKNVIDEANLLLEDLENDIDRLRKR